MPIVEGTDPNDLNKGVGHYKGSYFPGENGQIVLSGTSGHRVSPIRGIGRLGDKFEMQLANGSFTYEISHTKIVESDDTSIITLQNEEEELIVNYLLSIQVIGDAPQRYIIYAKPIKAPNHWELFFIIIKKIFSIITFLKVNLVTSFVLVHI